MMYAAEFLAGLLLIGAVQAIGVGIATLAVDTPQWVWWLLVAGFVWLVHWLFYPAYWLWVVEVSAACVFGPTLSLLAGVTAYYRFKDNRRQSGDTRFKDNRRQSGGTRFFENRRQSGGARFEQNRRQHHGHG